MLIYLSGLVFLCIAKEIWKDKKRYVFAAIAILLFIYTFRARTVGYDTPTYINIFHNISETSVFRSYLEPGWIIINKVIYTISPTTKAFFFFSGLCAMSCVFWCFKRLSSDIHMSVISYVMLGFYFNLMNQTRSSFAYSICLLSFYFLYKERYIWSVLISLLAFFVHKSALVFTVFILFVILFRKFKRRTLARIIIIGTILIFVNFKNIYSFMIQYYFQQYATPELLFHNDSGSLRVFAAHLVLFVFTFYIDRMTHHSLYAKNDESGLRWLLYMAVLFGLALQLISVNNRSVSRFSYFFDIYYCILTPNALKSMINRRHQKQYKVVYILYLCSFMLLYLVISGNGKGHDTVIPYIFDFSFS